ncbi:hypothetical protein HYW83_02000 [Candidatus Peregrinibacteria bacterium]|nr:hypothetical protein [Candidatus Peregrinibacteria bacterium]
MNSRHIIAEAWHFTRENKKLMWWYAFVPSILTTLVGILYLVYQFFSFKRSPLFDDAEKSFLTEVITTIFNFLKENENLLIPAIITIIVVLILYALLPTLLQGGLVQIIARMRKGESVKTSDGVSYGFLVFLPLLEYHLLIKGFSLISLFTEAGFVLRNLGPGALKTLLPVFIAAAVIGLILTLLFTYSEFFIILDKKQVLRSMGRSAKLVVLSWQHTFLIALLMIIIAMRIFINIIAVLIVPALLIFAAGFLATLTLTKIGIIVGIAIALVGLFVASYFTGILNVFANAVWTFTFLELMHEKRTHEFMSE